MSHPTNPNTPSYATPGVTSTQTPDNAPQEGTLQATQVLLTSIITLCSMVLLLSDNSLIKTNTQKTLQDVAASLQGLEAQYPQFQQTVKSWQNAIEASGIQNTSVTALKGIFLAL